MQKRNATLVTLTAMLLASLIATSHNIAVADSDPKSEAASDENPSVRETVKRAIPYLERAGEVWIKKRQCVSCHQIPFMLWSLSAADAKGYAVNRPSLTRWTTWSTEVPSFVKPAQKDDVEVASTLAANIDTLNALLLGIPAQNRTDGTKENGSAIWRQVFVNALKKNQLEQGGWKPCGQLPAQKRPLEETTQVTTAWTLLALNRERASTGRDQQAVAILQNAHATSTEWWAVRLLLANERDDLNADAFCDALIKKQHADGGWGWLTTDSSDALATGMALYALSRHSDKKTETAISKAVTFLTSSQSLNGSWKVPGTKKTTRNEPTPTSNYWGTAWAVIGLLESER
jgi:squalene-hopene/tetraprenyl-beta-curcumene cyclase